MRQVRVPYLVSSGVQVRYTPCARLVRPVAVRILPEKVIVVGLINHQGNLRRSRWTLLFKSGHLDIGIISQYPGDHIRTRFRLRATKSLEARGGSWLVKGGITAPLSFTALHLFRVIHVEGVRKAVVCFAEGCVLIPAFWFVEGFRSRKRRFPRTFVKMHFTEGFARYHLHFTASRALTLISLPCFL